MGQTPTLHMLYTCPFCWKVRGLIEYIDLDVEYISVNGMKIKKEVDFAGDWGKVPVFTDENGQYHTWLYIELLTLLTIEKQYDFQILVFPRTIPIPRMCSRKRINSG